MHERHPPPTTNATEARAWVRTVLPLFTAAILVYGGLAWLHSAPTPTSPTASPPIAAAAPSPMASPFVVNVVMPDRMTVVTPEPPTPTPSPPKATPVGLDISTNNTPRGTVCKQPKSPAPPPTEIPDCPVDVGKNCVSQGKPVTWLPTPLPTEGDPYG